MAEESENNGPLINVDKNFTPTTPSRPSGEQTNVKPSAPNHGNTGHVRPPPSKDD